MDLSYIPNMNADVENIIWQFKLDLDFTDRHKKQMKKILTEMIKKITCVKCKINIKEYHVLDKNNPDRYIQSPLCSSCFLLLPFSVFHSLQLLFLSDVYLDDDDD